MKITTENEVMDSFVLFNINIMRTDIRRNLSIVAEEEEEEEEEEYQANTDNVIESLANFEEVITTLENELKNKFSNEDGLYTSFFQTFYRGQANLVYPKTPGVFRNDLIEKEHIIINEAKSKYPYEFAHLNTSFELIAKLQHYGSATRLLDFSFDPYIALYFACKDDKDNDGEVIMYRSMCVDQNDIGVQTLSLFAQYHYSFGDLYEYLRIGLKQVYSDEYLLNLVRGSYFVMPTLSNERIFRQKGIFLMFGQNNIANNSRLAYKHIQILDDTTGRGEKYSGGITNIIIPSASKKRLLLELQLRGICEEFLFPDLDKGLRMINDKYKIKYQ